jgi:hypothetical protein
VKKIILVGSLLTVSCQTPVSSTNAPTQTADDRGSKLLLYMGCLGISNAAAARLLKATDGDEEKTLTATHLAVTGELSQETPLTDREKACRKSSGL